MGEQGNQWSLLKSLPDDWWSRRHTCQTLSECFTRHLLLLHAPFKRDGETLHELSSGFVLAIGPVALWITAGHVVDMLMEMRDDSSIELGNVRWMDNHTNPWASSMPARLEPDDMFSATRFGSDWGCIRLSPLYLHSLASNPDFAFLTPDVWRVTLQPSATVGEGSGGSVPFAA
jgi:hypothetical protein